MSSSVYVDEYDEVRNSSGTGTTPSGTTPSGTTPSDMTPSDMTPSDTTPSDMTPSDTIPSGTSSSDIPSDTRVRADTPRSNRFDDLFEVLDCYQSVSYYILKNDGSMSEEIFEEIPFESFFPDGWEERTICMFSYDSIKEDSSGKLFDFLNKIKSGISINFVIDPHNNGEENLWLKERGYPGVQGDVILTAETFSENFENENFTVPVKESIDIVEKILSSRGKTLIDCIIHVTRIEEFNKSRVDGIDGFMATTREELSSIGEKKKKVKSVESPDDNCSVLFEKKCVVCDKSKRNCGSSKITSCPCLRVYYCSCSCQFVDWKVHRKYVHKGAFF